MSIERVKNYFKGYGMEERIQEFDVSSATVELAAAALDCEPGGEPGAVGAFAFAGRGGRVYRPCRGRGMPVCGQRRGGCVSGCIFETIYHCFSRLRQFQQRD